jgi:hypothetical protein
MLSNRDRPGLAPSTSNEFGRGRRRELAPSTSLVKRPRGRRGRSWSIGGDCPRTGESPTA